MKVSTLIEQLNACDPDADVLVYSQIDEGCDQAYHGVYSMEEGEKLYCKGDTVAAYADDPKNYIVIG